MNSFIVEFLKEHNNIDTIDRLKRMGKIARASKSIGVKINFTQCKSIERIFYGYGFLNYFLVKTNESLNDYLIRVYK
ncbi:MAG: hypothetical protein JXQ96_14780 [Cyclobacteriaceae bacterium]